ncbi:MAG: hypothetical protein VX699_12345, partial [Myxococcota bacterium]|nr:hypothetical protein [Myxococcota bacterium]
MVFDTFKKGVDAQMMEWGENVRSVHESFKGNGAYDSLIRDLEAIDWANISNQGVSNVADTVAKETAKKGISVGRSFLSTFLKSVDPSGGALVTAGEMLLDWGTDMLWSNAWGEDMEYQIGDLVIMLDGPPPKTELRRRMVGKAQMATGVVVGDKANGTYGVFNTKTRQTEERAPELLKKIPADKVEDSTLAHISQALHQVGFHPPQAEPSVFHVGDVVQFKGKPKIYVVTQINSNGSLEVQRDEPVQTSKGKRFPNKTYLVPKEKHAQLIMLSAKTADGFFPGQILWFPSKKVSNAKFIAGVVQQVSPEAKTVHLVSLFDASLVSFQYHKLWKSTKTASDFPGFVSEALAPKINMTRLRKLLPSQTSHGTAMVTSRFV